MTNETHTTHTHTPDGANDDSIPDDLREELGTLTPERLQALKVLIDVGLLQHIKKSDESAAVLAKLVCYMARADLDLDEAQKPRYRQVSDKLKAIRLRNRMAKAVGLALAAALVRENLILAPSNDDPSATHTFSHFAETLSELAYLYKWDLYPSE